jgi:hypothetical protein
MTSIKERTNEYIENKNYDANTKIIRCENDRKRSGSQYYNLSKRTYDRNIEKCIGVKNSHPLARKIIIQERLQLKVQQNKTTSRNANILYYSFIYRIYFLN